MIRYNRFNPFEGIRYYVHHTNESASLFHRALAHLINIQGGLALLALASLQHTKRAGPRGPARFFYSAKKGEER
jgi:hypothetical protein